MKTRYFIDAQAENHGRHHYIWAFNGITQGEAIHTKDGARNISIFSFSHCVERKDEFKEIDRKQALSILLNCGALIHGIESDAWIEEAAGEIWDRECGSAEEIAATIREYYEKRPR